MCSEKPLGIVALFDSYAVVEKPGGVLSVPGRGPEKQDCVVSRFRFLFPDAIAHASVHRLDMETSGLLLMARTKEAHRNLSIQFIEHRVDKKYIAVVEGRVEEEEGRIDLPFRLDPDNRPYQVYDTVYGKMGTSLWRRIAWEGDCTRIEFTPLTGRTHQLRLHSAHPLGLGFPIVGDCLYGTGTSEYELLKLHASYLAFNDPETGERREYSSPVPF